MAKREGEVSSDEAAAILGYRSSRSVMALFYTRRLPGRAEPIGVLGRKRYWFLRSDVERLKQEASK